MVEAKVDCDLLDASARKIMNNGAHFGKKDSPWQSSV